MLIHFFHVLVVSLRVWFVWLVWVFFLSYHWFLNCVEVNINVIGDQYLCGCVSLLVYDFRYFMGCRQSTGFFFDHGMFNFFPLLCVVFTGNSCTMGMFWMSLLAYPPLFSLSVLPHSVHICLFKIAARRPMPVEVS